MADVEKTLLAKAIQTGDVTELMARGIEPQHFADPDCRELYEFSLDFMRLHVDSPTKRVIKEEFPEFKMQLVQEPLSYHMERFLLKAKERTAIELVRDYHDAIDDPERVIDIEVHAGEMFRKLSELVPAPRATRYSDAPGRIDEYRRREREGINHGIFLGVPTLDKVMLGLQPHEFAVIVAYMGVGKSTLIKKISHAAYLQNKTSVIIALEEEAEAVMRKIDVMVSNVKYWAMKALELEVGDIETWKRIAERAYDDRHKRDIVVIDDIKGCTVDHVQARMMRYKADICMVDYLELMKNPRGSAGWEAVSQNAIGLKELARTMKTPIISAAQLNRDGGKGDVNLANVSHQSVGKHADILIAMAPPEEGDDEGGDQQEMGVMLLKNRDGPRARCLMRWQLQTMDIREKGTSELFPSRKEGKKRRSRNAQRLDVARERASAPKGSKSPWAKRERGEHKTSPFTKMAKEKS